MSEWHYDAGCSTCGGTCRGHTPTTEHFIVAAAREARERWATMRHGQPDTSMTFFLQLERDHLIDNQDHTEER